MKNVLCFILSLLLVCSMSACGDFNNSNSATIESSAEPASKASVDVFSGPVVSATVTPDTSNYVCTPSLPNLIGRAPASTETWSVYAVFNLIPFTPDGYTGVKADCWREYLDIDGNTKTTKKYHVAFITEPDSIDNYVFDERIVDTVTVNGKELSGSFLMQKETAFVLECSRIDGYSSIYRLDIDLPNNIWYAYVLDKNNDGVLISAGSYIFVYKFESKSCELITADSLDYNYEDDGKLYFTDWLHDEYVCDWSKTTESTKTGKQVIHYFSDDFSLEVDESFESDFKTMQNALRDGTAENSDFDHLYTIYSFGNIYDIGGSYLSNIHYPKPYIHNVNVFSNSMLGIWLSENSTITLYRYGEIVRSYDMGNGLWRIIETEIDLPEKEDTVWLEYDIDKNGDGLYSIKETDDAILSIKFLLYNAKDHCIYISNNGEKPFKVAEDVVDFQEAYGELYWMNAKLEAYELSWREKTDSVLIGTDVVGISHYADERAGFVVAPGDLRCNATSNGFSLCTLYGREWMNQEQTSGAWALEYDWN